VAEVDRVAADRAEVARAAADRAEVTDLVLVQMVTVFVPSVDKKNPTLLVSAALTVPALNVGRR
jgi:hypothetical protein